MLWDLTILSEIRSGLQVIAEIMSTKRVRALAKKRVLYRITVVIVYGSG